MMKTGLTKRLRIILALLIGLGLSSPALGDSTTPKAAAAEAEQVHKEEVKAEHTSGLSRFDLGLWTLIVFGVLVVVLGKFAWGPIMAGLEKREATIAGYHSEAEKARAEAEKLLLEIKAQRVKANEEMAALIAEARRDADAYREAEKARTAGDIQADRERMKREIEVARDQALAEIWDKTVQLATLVSSKAIGRVVSPDDHRRLIDESLAELNERLTGTKA
jgi:F-type H+-transporting ATPase subunit b